MGEPKWARRRNKDDETYTNYQSMAESNPNDQDPLTAPRNSASVSGGDPSTAFRGFSTSINDMFRNTEMERVDCCALTCCGVLQNDRDRYLLTGVTPPSPFKRIVMHVILPFSIFFLAGMGAMRIRDARLNQIFSTGLIALLIFYFCMQCAKGRAKRIEIRKDLLFTKYQLQRDGNIADVLEHERPYEDDDDSEVEREYYLGQTRRDLRCAHPCCLISCYADDRHNEDVSQEDDNVCNCMYEIFCPVMCGMHLQLCGLCAIAQEARDIEKCVLPVNYRRIDYITMEPWNKYYAAVYHHKHRELQPSEGEELVTEPKDGRSGSLFGHPLSLLSARLLQSLLVFWTVVLVWSIFGPLYWTKIVGQRGKRHSFGVPDWLLLVLIFMQSFAILLLWRYFINRNKNSELSMDALIKYYSSGFFLAASLALFWELLAAVVVRTFVSLLLAVAGVDVMNDPESDLTAASSMPGSSYLTTISTPLLKIYLDTKDVTAGISTRPDYKQVFG